MFLIAHRGNINGKNIDKENEPSYVLNAINKEFDVEIDVWYINNAFFLGHDSPQYKVDAQFLSNDKMWCHAKNIEALYQMTNYDNIHCFWHQTDDVTLTSKGYLWTFPGNKLTKNSISVKQDYEIFPGMCAGICCDYIGRYKNG